MMALDMPVFPIFTVILACLVVTSSVVGQDDDTEATIAGVVGDEVEIPCDVDSFSSPPHVAWKDMVYNMGREPAVIYQDGQHMQDHMHSSRFSVSTDFTLTISDLATTDVGSYFCESTLSDGNKLTKRYSLVLIEHPKCQGETELTEGENMELTCSAAFSGSGGDMAWYLGDERMDSDDQTSVTELLIIFKAEASGRFDKKDLTCKLMFGDNSITCFKSMDIQYAPKVDFPDTTVTEESATVLTCNAPSNPTPTITLFKVNTDGTETQLKSGDGVMLDVDAESGVASVTFSSIDRKHAGLYKCNSINAMGEDNATAMLIVTDKPIVPTSPPETQAPDKQPSNSGNNTPGDASLVRHSLLLMLSACLVVLHLL